MPAIGANIIADRGHGPLLQPFKAKLTILWAVTLCVGIQSATVD